MDGEEPDSVGDPSNPPPEELHIIQDPVAAFYGRLRRSIQALKNELQQQQPPSEAGRVLRTLNKIIRNVSENPGEMKFKKLRKGNQVMQTHIMPYKAAVEILKLIGFCDDDDDDGWGESESFLTLKRNDPGILWLAKSSLEEHMP
ncbi:hypothetical protein M569_15794 [Genlisea aurea]|uniref:PUB domain-containing protein n=1 Tax=Genlisea aurea TaxID=192259 RepID=S8DHY9_9LAMI|nr:hypothetical protein M569_15794 [Genlisea aurea]